MLKKVFLGLLVIILLLGIGSLFISNIHHIERSTYINASPKVIFNELNTLSSWEKWNTWLQMDTTMKISYNNIKSGVGSEILWSSANQNVGNGTMTITKSEPDKTVETELNFNGKGKGINGFKLEPAGDSTKLTTYFTSDMGWNPVFKYLSLMSKKAMIEMTDNGLKSIKDYIEQMMLSATPDTKIDLVEMKESVPYLAVHAIASADKINGIFKSANKLLKEEISKQKLEVSKSISPFAIYYKAANDTFEFDVCMPTNVAGKSSDGILSSNLRAGRYIMSRYFGRYEDTMATHLAIQQYAKDNKLAIDGPPVEVYVTDPAVEKDDSKWETDIYYPIQ